MNYSMKNFFTFCIICFGIVFTSCDKDNDLYDIDRPSIVLPNDTITLPNDTMLIDSTKCECGCCEDITFDTAIWENYTELEKASFFVKFYKMVGVHQFAKLDIYLMEFKNDGRMVFQVAPTAVTKFAEYEFEPIEVNGQYIKYETKNEEYNYIMYIMVGYIDNFQCVVAISSIPYLPYFPIGQQTLVYAKMMNFE